MNSFFVEKYYQFLGIDARLFLARYSTEGRTYELRTTQKTKDQTLNSMAIYHCSIKPVSRSSGTSAVAAIAYRSGELLQSEIDGITHDYTRKQGIEHTGIVLPELTQPEWAKDRNTLWNRADLSEHRKDARVAREVEVSLPHELSSDERLSLTKEFSQYLADQYKVAVDFAIHAPHRSSDDRNFHAHILMTTRVLNEQGFGEKSIFEKESKWLIQNNLPTGRMQIQAVREKWADFANAYLLEKGLDINIDHRSFANRGIELAPTQHMGVHATQMKQRGIDTDRNRLAPEDAKLNAKLIQKRPEEVFKVITSEKSVFNHHDVAKAIHRYTDSLEDFQCCMAKVMASQALVVLEQGQGDQPTLYSTPDQIAVEQNMLSRVLSLSEQMSHPVNDLFLNLAIESQEEAIRATTDQKFGLSDEQKIAIKALATPNRITLVEGLAGAGKSTLLAATKEAWEAQGYQVYGAALAGKAAEGLQESAGITSKTLAAWEFAFQNGRAHLDKSSVFVIDEAGMVSSKQLARFIEKIDHSGAKLVLVGDSEQLQPINSGAPFRAISQRIGSSSLVEIRRQRVDWQRDSSVDFAQQRTEQALTKYQQEGRVQFENSNTAARSTLIQDYLDDVKTNPKDSRLVLAHRRVDVFALNQEIREGLKANSLTRILSSTERTYTTNAGQRSFGIGDRFIFLENNRELEVKNGMLGEVQRVTDRYIMVKLDNSDMKVNVPVEDYKAFDHGYATTIHKSQGATVDRSFVLASKYMDRHLSYVAMTRHRNDAKLYVNQEDFKNMAALTAQLGRGGGKETTVDYLGHVNLDLPKRNYLAPLSAFERAMTQYVQAFHSIEKQKEMGLPVLHKQTTQLQTAHNNLEKARSGAAELLQDTLAQDQAAKDLVVNKPKREHIEQLLDRMQARQSGQQRTPDRSPSRPIEPVSRPTQSQPKTQNTRLATPFEQAVNEFSKVVESIENQKAKNLPVLERQKRAFELTKDKVDALKPDTADAFLYALRHDQKTRDLLNRDPSLDRTKDLVERIDAHRAPAQEFKEQQTREKEQKELERQRQLENSRGWGR